MSKLVNQNQQAFESFISELNKLIDDYGIKHLKHLKARNEAGHEGEIPYTGNLYNINIIRETLYDIVKKTHNAMGRIIVFIGVFSVTPKSPNLIITYTEDGFSVSY